MSINNEQESRKEFRALLTELSEDQIIFSKSKALADTYKRLEAIYYCPQIEGGFRHFYSDIFEVLADEDCDRDILGQNISFLRKHYRPKNKDTNGLLIDISQNLKKLDDHISLEIARLSYADKDEMELELQGISSQVYSLEDAVDNTKKIQKEIARKVGRQEREYIAILGIFAAIIITFVGGISFTSSILESIGNAHPKTLLIVGVTIGLVLVNSLYGLFHYIERIVNPRVDKKPIALLISNIALLSILVMIMFSKTQL